VNPTPPARASRRDLIAGVSVGLVLIPQSMAYAELAGLPAQHGLYAAAFAPLAMAPLASSPYLQTGPGALTCLLTLGALVPLAPAGSPRFVALAALLALVVGIIRALVGLLRAGPIAYLLSRPVMDGFTTGAGILILSTQIPGALGVGGLYGRTLEGAWEALAHPGDWHRGALALTGLTLVLMLGARRRHPRFPGVLVAVVAGIVATDWLGYTGPTLGAIPARFPRPDLALPWGSLHLLLIPGGVIALAGFAEVTSISRTFAAIDRQVWNPSREFVAQGAANLASCLVSGMPVGGSFARSGLNRLAGARSRWSGAFAGLTVLAFLPAATLLSALPRAVLSGIVIASVVSLVRFRPLLRLFRFAQLQGIAGVSTLILTLALAPHVEWAVIAGVGMALGIHYWRESQVRVRVQQVGPTVVLRPSGVLWFGSAPSLESAITEAVSAHDDIERVELDLTGVGRVDYSGAEMLRTVRREVLSAGLSWGLTHVPAHARRVLEGVLGPI